MFYVCSGIKRPFLVATRARSMVRDAHPTICTCICTCIDRLYYPPGAYRAEVYLYPTGVGRREGCKSLIVTSNRPGRNLEQRGPSDVEHAYSEPQRLRRPNAAVGRGNTLLCSFGRSWAGPCPCPCRSINLGMGCGVHRRGLTEKQHPHQGDDMGKIARLFMCCGRRVRSAAGSPACLLMHGVRVGSRFVEILLCSRSCSPCFSRPPFLGPPPGHDHI